MTAANNCVACMDYRFASYQYYILSCIYNTCYIILLFLFMFFLFIIILLLIIILLGLLLILLGQHILRVYKLDLERIKFIAKLSIRKLKFLSLIMRALLDY